jgi:hypothetical protein
VAGRGAVSERQHRQTHRRLATVESLKSDSGVGGFVVVLLTAGRSIAVQGFNENLSVLVMLAVYAVLLAMDAPIVVTLWLLGLFVAAAVGALMLREHRRVNGFGFDGPR